MRVKRLFVYIIVLCLISCSLYGSSILKVQYKQSLNFINGHIYEGVYYTPDSNTNLQLSKLDWELVNVPALNYGIGFTILDYIQLDLNGIFGISGRSGYMQDYDWRNVEITGTQELTNYSIHENNLEQYNEIFFKLGGNIYVSHNFLINPYFSMGFENIGFLGKNGYGQYGKKYSTTYKAWDAVDDDGNPEYNLKNFDGDVISYKQSMYYYGFGVSTKFNIQKILAATTLFEFYPFLSYLSIDNHYRRVASPNQFADELSNVPVFKMYQDFSFKINDLLNLGIQGNVLYMPEAKGTTYSRYYYTSDYYTTETNWSTDENYKGGTERILYSLGIYFQLNF